MTLATCAANKAMPLSCYLRRAAARHLRRSGGPVTQWPSVAGGFAPHCGLHGDLSRMGRCHPYQNPNGPKTSVPQHRHKATMGRQFSFSRPVIFFGDVAPQQRKATKGSARTVCFGYYCSGNQSRSGISGRRNRRLPEMGTGLMNGNGIDDVIKQLEEIIKELEDLIAGPYDTLPPAELRALRQILGGARDGLPRAVEKRGLTAKDVRADIDSIRMRLRNARQHELGQALKDGVGTLARLLGA